MYNRSNFRNSLRNFWKMFVVFLFKERAMKECQKFRLEFIKVRIESFILKKLYILNA